MGSSALRRFALVAGLLGLAILAGWFLLRAHRSPGTGPAETVGKASTAEAGRPAAAPSGDRGEAKSADKLSDYGAALDEVRGLVNPRQRSREFGRILLEWIARDPEAALAYVRLLPHGAEYTQGLLMVVEAVGRRDPERALGLAGELAATREQRAIYSLLFAQFAAQDVRTAVQRLDLVPPGESRDNALRALADEWVRHNPAAALAWAQTLPPADRSPALEAVLTTLLANDPLRAMEVAQQSLTGAALDRIRSAALQKLTLTDPEAAGAIVSLLPPGEGQTLAALDVARALAGRDPAAALTWIKTLPAGEAQRLALNNTLGVWAAQDAAAAGRFVAQMDAGAIQVAAAEHLARVLAVADPAGAIAWAQTLADSSARDLAFTTIASTWAQRDPAAAAGWASNLTASAQRTEALNGALSYWLLRDVAATQAFVANLPAETQVSAAGFIAPIVAQTNPVAALEWAQSLPLPAARELAAVSAYLRWLDNAPVAAKAWLATANLPDEMKTRLLKEPSP